MINEQVVDYRGTEIKVLDKGLVKLIDFCGSDARIVQAARVSYGEGTKSVSSDRGLIRYLVRNHHNTPLEMVNFTFLVKMPIVIARQHSRHRTAKINEISGRYSIIKDEYYVPNFERMAQQSTDNKQGSSHELIANPRTIQLSMEAEAGQSFQNYDWYVESGLAREVARINLPLSTYTEMYWQMDLHNLFHYLHLRLDSHAQYEIRVYAQAMLDLISPIVPHAVEAFTDYILEGQHFSKQEMYALGAILQNCGVDVEQTASTWLKGRELREFLDKYNTHFE